MLFVALLSICLYSCSLQMSDGSVFQDAVMEETETVRPGSSYNPYEISSYGDLVDMFELVVGSGRSVKAVLTSDIVIPTPEDPNDRTLVDFPEGVDIDLDLRGHSIIPAEDLSGTNKYLAGVYGSLNVHDGRLGDDDLEGHPISRVLWVLPGAELELRNVTVCAYSTTYGSAIYVDGYAMIDKSEIHGTKFAMAVTESGSCLIRGNSLFTSIASNRLTYDESGTDGYAYTLYSDGDITIESARVFGLQGAISINAGSARLYDGVYAHATENIMKIGIMPQDYETFYLDHRRKQFKGQNGPVKDELYYGLYVAGETNLANEPQCAIYGGEYISNHKNAVQVGNANDGGVGATAYAVIYAGRFTKGAGVNYAIDAEGDPGYGRGVISIEGGLFCSNVNLNQLIDDTQFKIEGPRSDGYYEVVPV